MASTIPRPPSQTSASPLSVGTLVAGPHRRPRHRLDHGPDRRAAGRTQRSAGRTRPLDRVRTAGPALPSERVRRRHLASAGRTRGCDPDRPLGALLLWLMRVFLLKVGRTTGWCSARPGSSPSWSRRRSAAGSLTCSTATVSMRASRLQRRQGRPVGVGALAELRALWPDLGWAGVGPALGNALAGEILGVLVGCCRGLDHRKLRPGERHLGRRLGVPLDADEHRDRRGGRAPCDRPDGITAQIDQALWRCQRMC